MTQPTKRVLSASEVYNRVDSMELFAKLQGYSLASARVAVSRWRDKHGVALFPYKRAPSTRAKIRDIQELSRIWKSNNATDAAVILGFSTPGALRSLIVAMRRDHGAELFPHKRSPTAVRDFINERNIMEASKLWKTNMRIDDIASQLNITKAELREIVESNRRTAGLANFPYRGLIAV